MARRHPAGRHRRIDGIDSGRGASLESAAAALLESQVIVYVVSNMEISRASKLADLDSLMQGGLCRHSDSINFKLMIYDWACALDQKRANSGKDNRSHGR